MYRSVISIGILLLVGYQVYTQPDLYSFTQDDFRKYDVFNKTVETTDQGVKIMNAVLFYVTNTMRIDAGLSPLKYNKLLEKSAMLHSKDMVRLNFFDHENTKNNKHRTPEDRARSAGIENPYIAENIIDNFVLDYKSGTPVYTDGKGKFWYKKESDPVQIHTYLSLADKMLKEWMNSKGHRKNILSKDAIELGCGVAFYNNSNGMPSIMGTQNFQLYEPVK